MRDAQLANAVSSIPANLPNNVFITKAASSKKKANGIYNKKGASVKAPNKQLNKQSKHIDDHDDESQSGLKRKARDGDQSISKRTKTFSDPRTPAGLSGAPRRPLPLAYPFSRNFGTAPIGRGFSVPPMPTASTMRFDKVTNDYVVVDSVDKSGHYIPKPVPSIAGPRNGIYSPKNESGGGPPQPSAHHNNDKTIDMPQSRKRSAADAEDIEQDSCTASKRARPDDNDTEEGEITVPTTMSASEVVQTTKKNKKHGPRAKRKPRSEVVQNMRDCDLTPHYRPDPEALLVGAKAREAAKPSAPAPPAPPKQLMDLPVEVRLNIWDKVFEDESYSFKPKTKMKPKTKKRSGNRNDDTNTMYATPPPSISCLLISRALYAEVQAQMYASMRLSLDFGRLRPHAVRAFTHTLAQHRLGVASERIFFAKTCGLRRVNLGLFASACEIVSTGWTVQDDRKMDAAEYKADRIDPRFVLGSSPPDEDKLKGLKERRFWPDQLAASQRFQRHVEGWCHPDAKDPHAKGFNPETDAKKCPFRNQCLNLGEREFGVSVGETECRKKKTKFCMLVKYKFSTTKGRHARHKEAVSLFAFPPLLLLIYLYLFVAAVVLTDRLTASRHRE